MPLLCSIVLSHLSWCWYCDLRFIKHPTAHYEPFNVINRLRCERRKVSISKETTLSWKKQVNQGVFNAEWKDLLSSNVLQVLLDIYLVVPHYSNNEANFRNAEIGLNGKKKRIILTDIATWVTNCTFFFAWWWDFCWVSTTILTYFTFALILILRIF